MARQSTARERTDREKRPGGKSPSPRTAPEAAPSPRDLYRSAVARGVLLAASRLASAGAGPVGKRALVNFLRGNQLPRGEGQAPAQEDGFGLLSAHGARWVEELVEGVADAGYLSREPRPGNLPPALATTAEGLAALRGECDVPPEVLPEDSVLGAHPKTEEKLRDLRRLLAHAENRAAYGIFPNAVLAALAARRPRTLADLSAIPGMGEARIRKYGRRILEAVKG